MLQVLLPMDTQISSITALKPAQEQEIAEDWRRAVSNLQTAQNETELDVPQRLRNKGARKQRERGCTKHAIQTVSERQANSQWKSTRERGADTPKESLRNEERKFSDTAL